MKNERSTSVNTVRVPGAVDGSLSGINRSRRCEHALIRP